MLIIIKMDSSTQSFTMSPIEYIRIVLKKILFPDLLFVWEVCMTVWHIQKLYICLMFRECEPYSKLHE